MILACLKCRDWEDEYESAQAIVKWQRQRIAELEELLEGTCKQKSR
jgi:hypothetical protein